ncbi:MAG: CopG family transcriptional regulator [Gammaproteobacteria bacterium]|nr:CopG family transcriptional regulator [Gammaproteobacteria bacterium]
MPSYVRTIIQISEEPVRGFKVHMRDEERSTASLVRESVAENQAHRPAQDRRALLDRARGLVGRFRSGYSDVAENHDRHLDEAYDSFDRKL